MKIRDRGRLLVQWAFVDPKAAWGALALPGVALLFIALSPFPFAPELRVRIAGLVVTLAGAGLVLIKIRDRQRNILAWLKRFPAIFLRPTPTVVHAEAAISGVSATKAQLRRAAGPAASLEDRMTVLEQNLEETDKQIREVETEITTSIRQLQSANEAERTNREEQDRALGKQVEQLSVAGLNVELMGVAWVIFGSILATLPGEIACLLVRVCGEC